MKILCCSSGLSYQVDAAYSTRLRANAMSQEGADVMVLGFPSEYPSQGKSCDFTYSSVLRSASVFKRLFWTLLRRILGNFWTFLVEPWIVQIAAIKMMRKGDYDVLYLTHLEPVLMLPLWPLVRILRIRVYGMIPTVFYTQTAMEGRPLVSRLRGLLNHKIALVLPRFMCVIANSRYVFDVMGMSGCSNTVVIQEGYEDLIGSRDMQAARERLGLPGNQRILLLLGAASRAKGADLLFQAMEQIQPSFMLCVVGQTGGVYERTWGDLSRLKERGWGDLIRIDARYVDEEELMDYYAACDGVVIPYRKGFATSSTHLRHASEYGKAIIACDQYLIGEIVRQYGLGLLFEPENTQNIAEALSQFAAKSEEWFTRIKINSAVVNQRLGWAECGHAYIALFNKE
jgi:glycosyltransferase involved in cell wall biosynthesis